MGVLASKRGMIRGPGIGTTVVGTQTNLSRLTASNTLTLRPMIRVRCQPSDRPAQLLLTRSASGLNPPTKVIDCASTGAEPG